jgi:hypothetical protein
MRPYLHDKIWKITHTHRSCSQVIDLAASGHRTSSISADGLQTWFLAWLIKESFSLATLILVYKTKAVLNYAHLTRKNNEICSIQILFASSSSKWTQEKDRERVETYPLKNPSSWRRGSKRKPKCDGKSAASFPSACTSWCQEVLGYLPRTQLRERGMSQGFFWQLCSRDEQPNHPLSQEFF